MVRIGENLYPAGDEDMRQHMIDVCKTYSNLKTTITRQYEDRDTVISEIFM